MKESVLWKFDVMGILGTVGNILVSTMMINELIFMIIDEILENDLLNVMLLKL